MCVNHGFLSHWSIFANVDPNKQPKNFCLCLDSGVVMIQKDQRPVVQSVGMLSAEVLFPTLLYFYWYEKSLSICLFTDCWW